MRSVMQHFRALTSGHPDRGGGSRCMATLGRALSRPSLPPAPPSSILKLIVSSRIPWLYHTEVTLSEVFAGYSLAAVTGVSLAVTVSFFRSLRSVVEPLIVAAQVIPKIALIPILFLWFGFDIVPRFIAVFLVCFFPIVISSTAGFAAVDRDLVDLVRSYSHSRLLLLRKILFPERAPQHLHGTEDRNRAGALEARS